MFSIFSELHDRRFHGTASQAPLDDGEGRRGEPETRPLGRPLDFWKKQQTPCTPVRFPAVMLFGNLAVGHSRCMSATAAAYRAGKKLTTCNDWSYWTMPS